jgi:hypothetical protein
MNPVQIGHLVKRINGVSVIPVVLVLTDDTKAFGKAPGGNQKFVAPLQSIAGDVVTLLSASCAFGSTYNCSIAAPGGPVLKPVAKIKKSVGAVGLLVMMVKFATHHHSSNGT